MKKIFILIGLLFVTTGCSYQEINKLAIVSAVGVDIDKNANYVITAQIMNIKKNTDGSANPDSIIYKAKGESISQAIKNLTIHYPKSIYLNHAELVVFGKNVVSKNIDKTLDFFIRSPYMNSFATLIVNKDGTAAEILDPKVETKGEFPTKDIISSIEEASKKQGTVNEVNIQEFVSNHLEEGIDPTLPILTLTKTPPSETESSSTLTGMASFKNNIINEALDEDETIAFNTINNTYYDIATMIKYKNNKVSITIFNPKSKIDVKLNNNKANVNININLEARVSEVYKEINLLDEKVLKDIEKITEKNIKEKINKLLDYCKRNEVDLLGLKNSIYKKYNKEYIKYKNKNLYKEANITINTNVNMYRFGNVYTDSSNTGGKNES